MGIGPKDKRLRGQEVKTSPFHGGNTGSIPVGVIATGIFQLLFFLEKQAVFRLKICRPNF